MAAIHLASDILRECREAGLGHEILAELANAIAARCGALVRLYGAEPAPSP